MSPHKKIPDMDTDKMRILILEDSPADVEFVQRELRKSGLDFVSHVADTREEFIDGIQSFKPQVILSDHSLPQFNSIEALRITKELLPEIPFILVTGAVSEEFAVQVIKEGADDYILKGHLIRLPSAIDSAIRKKAAEKEREEILEKMLLTNNELNTFVYKATHDLRGPLTSIMGLTKLAEREENKSHSGAYLKMIAESTQKLDDILVSLIETMAIKNAELKITEIYFNALIDGILKSLEFSDGFDRIAIQITVAHHRKFYSDEKILGSVLQNVIENAVKYQNHSNSSPFVHVSVTDHENLLRIEVTDNGIGIDETIREKIFEMFYRGNESSKGSGLGLYLVKNGMQRLGGAVTLKSAAGAGTTISLLFPEHD
jgi:signal transduction histidine kinase